MLTDLMNSFPETSRKLVLNINPSLLTPSHSDVDPIRTHRIREVKKREGAISQEHAFYGRKFLHPGSASSPFSHLDRCQGSNHRLWILQDTVSVGKMFTVGFISKPTPHRNGCIIDQADLENLPWERETVGFWLDVPEPLLQLLVAQDVNPAGA